MQPGLTTLQDSLAHLPAGEADAGVGNAAIEPLLDGVMIGREAYHHPWLLAQVDPRLFGEPAPVADRAAVIEAISAYACAHVARGGRVRDITRHILGLYNGLPGARRWRQKLSDASLLAANDWRLIEQAAGLVQSATIRAN